MRFATGLFLAFILSFSVYAAEEITGPQPKLPLSPLTIATDDAFHHFRVELTNTDYQRQRGLMFREEVLPDEGMLFDFETEFERGFWMKNTLVPLDMLFIRADGTIHRIAANTIPLSEVPIRSFGHVRAVLELRGGRAAELGIEAGDVVRHQIFGNNPPLKNLDH
jgi:uncharacterized membrane protein (UPF0127 family)